MVIAFDVNETLLDLSPLGDQPDIVGDDLLEVAAQITG